MNYRDFFLYSIHSSEPCNRLTRFCDSIEDTIFDVVYRSSFTIYNINPFILMNKVAAKYLFYERLFLSIRMYICIMLQKIDILFIYQVDELYKI